MSTLTAPAKRQQCPKCDGKGKIRAHARVMGGVCWTCNGKGTVSAAYIAEADRARKASEARAHARNAKAAAEVETLEAAAFDRYGEDYRLAVALSQFDNPCVHAAVTWWLDMRDGADAWKIQRDAEKIPAVIDTLGLDGWALEDIEAKAGDLRAARLAH